MSAAASTTAAFIADGHLHAVRYLKAGRAQGQCGAGSSDDPVGIGLYYVPSWAFDGRRQHGDVLVCPRCSAILVSPPEAR